MSVRISTFIFAVVLAVSPLAHAADTLVVAAGNGTYKPGLATSWSAQGNRVTFVLHADADAKQVQALLKERLPTAQVSSAGNKLVVDGIAPPSLLEQLSLLIVSGNADPLASLAALGGGAAPGEQPEGGGSIRASKPTPLPGAADADIAANDKYEAQVMEVTPQAFPAVSLKLKIRRAALAGASPVKLTAGKVVDCSVAFGMAKGNVDFADTATQRNLGAYYLKKSDRVLVRFVQDGERLVADWIVRR